MFFACIAVFCRAFGQCFTKLIQKTYPNDFHTVPFLFLRSFMIVTLSLVHTYFTQVRIISPKEIPFKIWFFYRTNMNFFGMSFSTMALWYLRASTAQIIHSLHPIIVLILSYFILKEKYYPIRSWYHNVPNRLNLNRIKRAQGKFLFLLKRKFL